MGLRLYVASEFIEGLYEFYSNNPTSKVVVKIIGNDKISYGGSPPPDLRLMANGHEAFRASLLQVKLVFWVLSIYQIY